MKGPGSIPSPLIYTSNPPIPPPPPPLLLLPLLTPFRTPHTRRTHPNTNTNTNPRTRPPPFPIFHFHFHFHILHSTFRHTLQIKHTTTTLPTKPPRTDNTKLHTYTSQPERTDSEPFIRQHQLHIILLLPLPNTTRLFC